VGRSALEGERPFRRSAPEPLTGPARTSSGASPGGTLRTYAFGTTAWLPCRGVVLL